MVTLDEEISMMIKEQDKKDGIDDVAIFLWGGLESGDNVDLLIERLEEHRDDFESVSGIELHRMVTDKIVGRG